MLVTMEVTTLGSENEENVTVSPGKVSTHRTWSLRGVKSCPSCRNLSPGRSAQSHFSAATRETRNLSVRPGQPSHPPGSPPGPSRCWRGSSPGSPPRVTSRRSWSSPPWSPGRWRGRRSGRRCSPPAPAEPRRWGQVGAPPDLRRPPAWRYSCLTSEKCHHQTSSPGTRGGSTLYYVVLWGW